MKYRTRSRIRILIGLVVALPIFTNYWFGWPEIKPYLEMAVVTIAALLLVLGWAYYDVFAQRNSQNT